MGNGDLVDVQNFTAPIINSGLESLLYVPPIIPMALDDWPTLSSFILTGKRALFFLDYNANQTAIPYILDEFSQLSETPFSPTNEDFPCNIERPPGITKSQTKERLYMANHNLNANLTLLGETIQVPNTVKLNVTNNVTGFGSLGLMTNTCVTDWGRPPNFLLVDFYDIDNGTVFEIAAKANNVTYTRSCCGATSANANGAVGSVIPSTLLLGVAFSFMALFGAL
jgi:hypothetical protein